MLRRTVVISAVLLLGACAQPATKKAATASAANAAPGSGVLCEREMATGSHMPKRVCRTEAQREAARRATQDALQSSGRGVSKTPQGQR